jgi:hypothetical protein
MAINPSTDILLKLSVAAAAGDTTASSGAASLGDQVSTTQVSTSLHGLFDVITGSENAASTTDYRCVFVHNNHATLTAYSCTVFLTSAVASGADVTIAIDNIAASAKGSGSTQAATIGSETSAPSGVGSFSAPSTDGTGLALGDLAPGQVRAVWIKRVAANTGPVSADGVTLNVALDTAA